MYEVWFCGLGLVLILFLVLRFWWYWLIKYWCGFDCGGFVLCVCCISGFAWLLAFEVGEFVISCVVLLVCFDIWCFVFDCGGFDLCFFWLFYSELMFWLYVCLCLLLVFRLCLFGLWLHLLLLWFRIWFWKRVGWLICWDCFCCCLGFGCCLLLVCCLRMRYYFVVLLRLFGRYFVFWVMLWLVGFDCSFFCLFCLMVVLLFELFGVCYLVWHRLFVCLVLMLRMNIWFCLVGFMGALNC